MIMGPDSYEGSSKCWPLYLSSTVPRLCYTSTASWRSLNDYLTILWIPVPATFVTLPWVTRPEWILVGKPTVFVAGPIAKLLPLTADFLSNCFILPYFGMMGVWVSPRPALFSVNYDSRVYPFEASTYLPEATEDFFSSLFYMIFIFVLEPTEVLEICWFGTIINF